MTFSRLTHHLTDEQLADHLAGSAGRQPNDHVAICTRCREEVTRMRAALRVFDRASLEWSDHLPRLHRPAPAWRPAAVWAVVGVAVLCVVLLAGLLHRPRRVRIASISNPDSNTAELSQDNALLNAIDRELDSSQLSPQKMYGAQ